MFRFATKLKRVNLVNILVGHEAVPERLQRRCRPEILADDLNILLRDDPREQFRLGARIFAGLVIGAYLVGWLMYGVYG